MEATTLGARGYYWVIPTDSDEVEIWEFLGGEAFNDKEPWRRCGCDMDLGWQELKRVIEPVYHPEAQTEAKEILKNSWWAHSWADAVADDWSVQHEIRMLAVSIQKWICAVKRQRACPVCGAASLSWCRPGCPRLSR